MDLNVQELSATKKVIIKTFCECFRKKGIVDAVNLRDSSSAEAHSHNQL